MSNDFWVGMVVGSLLTVLPVLIRFAVKHVRIV